MIVAPQLEADVDVRIAPKVRPHAVQRKTDGIRIRGTRSGTAKAIHPVRRIRSDTDRRPRDFDVKTGARLRGHCPTEARIALQEWSFGVRVRPQGPRLRRAASRLWGLKARIALQEWSLGVRVPPQGLRFRRAASRLWGLTAHRDRANKVVQPTSPHCDAVRSETNVSSDICRWLRIKHKPRRLRYVASWFSQLDMIDMMSRKTRSSSDMPLGSVCACRVQREHRSNCHAEIDNGKFHDVFPAMVSVTQGFA